MHATCSVHVILLDKVNIIIYNEESYYAKQDFIQIFLNSCQIELFSSGIFSQSLYWLIDQVWFRNAILEGLKELLRFKVYGILRRADWHTITDV